MVIGEAYESEDIARAATGERRDTAAHTRCCWLFQISEELAAAARAADSMSSCKNCLRMLLLPMAWASVSRRSANECATR
jgi:hypothetical protein